ncbi:Na+/proline symporter [Halohasta litchfieldiae]|jgi:Na+/proline symporter|uniref:Na+/proline symporter n=1 Tax=Halohasta litchfieldiae TaxID=1073996 RepID=A0A1H6SBS2_9EURY|nr:sodium:solute symporter family protein [Halohasta litchfieldiae]ATW87922.1 Na+/proline symporter [Halohasta litchfieldiae]SEI62197.1 Na+/proline symporter [Halohasta litchfieldiae]
MSIIVYGIAAIIITMLAIGFYVSRKIKGDSINYIVAGRGLILPLAAATLMAQSLDSNATLGNTDLVSSFGFWAGAALPVGLALCLFLTGLFFAKPMNRMNLTTLPDFYRRKYGRTAEVLASVIMSVAYAFLLAGNLVAGGFLFEIFVGTSFELGVVIIAALVLSYTVAGGLFAVAYTDFLQAGVAFVGSIALIIFVTSQYGITIPAGMGPTNLGQLTDPSQGAYINLATIVALGLGDIVAIDFMERVFAADSPETARKACFIGSAGTLIIGIPFSIIALSANPILASLGVEAGNQAVLYSLLQNAVPPWLAALVIAGILAASFSTSDGAILGTSSVLARNIGGIRVDESTSVTTDGGVDQGGLFDTNSDSDKLLTVTRLMSLPITLLGIFFALRISATGMLLVLAFDIMLAGAFVPLVLGLYWSDMANTPAALSSMVAGSATRLILFVLVPTTYAYENTLLYIPNNIFTAAFDGLPTFIAAGVSLVTFVAVAYATKDSYSARTLTRDGRRTIVAGGDSEDE